MMTIAPTVEPFLPSAVAGPFALVRDDLEATERFLVESLSQFRDSFPDLLNHLRHYRGKRLRPALTFLIGHACGRVSPCHVTVAGVLEMIHTATLVHDDVLDEADVRRHVATVNAEWGNKTCILFGDLLFTHAFYLSSTLGDANVCRAIGEATNRVCAGELLQTTRRGNLHITESDYYAMIDGKTAALTACCGRLGAMLAGADARTIERMAEYGRSLGLAFQIADDLLDLTGDESTVGKTLGTDLVQGKVTLPLLHLFASLHPDRADGLRTALRKGAIEPMELRQLLEKAGSLKYARATAERHIDDAIYTLAELKPSPAREALETIAAWAVRRQS